jgi:hypothetical protein
VLVESHLDADLQRLKETAVLQQDVLTLLISARNLAENIVRNAAMYANHPAMMDFPPALPLSPLLHLSRNLNSDCIKYIK